ncbi:hypothetical protein I79_004092 [Cricetulus griseus]|uniref:Uncharacterized protein n=1 Tax=Cricetulus griseus TaxID=10029 RepID=G3H1R0_CRIGR|nr:hypothetical protein I79_004092 [Cricetulus griseus]
MEPPASGGRVGRASHLASGFSGILYLCSPDRAGKGCWGGREKVGLLWILAYPLPALGKGLLTV